MTEISRHRLFADAQRRCELSLRQLWVRYVAVTGICGVTEIDGFLNGLTGLPTVEQDKLAIALNESLDEEYQTSRVPYLASATSFDDSRIAQSWRPAEDWTSGSTSMN